MCHSRTNNSQINRLHERCLRIIYIDKQSLFELLLEKDKYVSIHSQNLQILGTEMYKIKNDLSPLIVIELFERRNEQHYDLKITPQLLRILPERKMYHELESISFLGPKIWNILPHILKNLLFTMLDLFKKISIKRKEQKISYETKVYYFMRF